MAGELKGFRHWRGKMESERCCGNIGNICLCFVPSLSNIGVIFVCLAREVFLVEWETDTLIHGRRETVPSFSGYDMIHSAVYGLSCCQPSCCI